MARAMRMHEMFNAPGKYKSRGEIAGDAARMAWMVMNGLIVVRKARGLIERAVKTVGWRVLARKGMKEEARKVLAECLKFEGMFGPEADGGKASEHGKPARTDGADGADGGGNGDPARG